MLRRRTKAGYGVADLGLSGAELLLQLYLLEFYIVGVGLNPLLAGAALAIATFWDAVSDPIMGLVTDRTRTKYGQFIPWLAIGSTAFGVGIILLFNPPLFESDISLFMYLLISYIFVNTGLTVVGVPHISMAGVLSNDTHERTELYAWRMGFGTIGLFVGILIPLVAAAVFSYDVESRWGLVQSRSSGAIIIAFLVIVFSWITIFAVRPKTATTAFQGTVEGYEISLLLRQLKSVFSNRVFLPLLVGFIIIAVGRALNATLALPYYKVSLNFSESQIQGPVLSVFTLFIILSLGIWSLLGRKYGKKWPGILGLLILGVMTTLAYPFFPKEVLLGPVLAAILGGLAVGAIILFESLVTDVSDKDFLESNENKEGLYFGVWKMGQKVARSIALALAGPLLAWIGYNGEADTYSASTANWISYIFGFGVGSLFLIAAGVLTFVPMGKAEQESIQKLKEKRVH